jgi:hypothetical protein
MKMKFIESLVNGYYFKKTDQDTTNMGQCFLMFWHVYTACLPSGWLFKSSTKDASLINMRDWMTFLLKVETSVS